MEINKYRTVCFSICKPENLPFSLDDKNSIEYQQLKKKVKETILNATQMGYNTYLCRMTKGFELFCAKVVVDIKRRDKRIKLVAILPHRHHSYSGNWANLFHAVRYNANHILHIAPNDRTRRCYQIGDNYMIKNSSYMICYWDGKKGNTAKAIKKAKKLGHIICNLADQTPSI